MLASRRVLSLLGACGALAAAATPVVALAHGGDKGRRVHGQDIQGQDNQDNGNGFGRRLSQPARICRKVGVSLNGRPVSGRHLGHNPFNETQIKELQAACNTLKKGFETEHNAISAALKTKREKIEAALKELPEGCPPRRHHHHDHGDFGPTGATGASGATGKNGSTGPSGATGPSRMACKEAREKFRKAVEKADEEFRNAIKPAAETLEKELEKFDATVKPILESVRHNHQPMGPTGTSGPSGPTGPSGKSGSTGTTGFPGQSRDQGSGSWQQGGSGSWGGQQQGGDYSSRSADGR